MTKYLISFPSGAMVLPDGDLQAVSEAAHAVVEEAKNAGVWVFGGGIDESVPPVLVDGDGTVTEGTYSARSATRLNVIHGRQDRHRGRVVLGCAGQRPLGSDGWPWRVEAREVCA